LKDSLIALSKDALFSLRDLAPIAIVIAVFQIFVIKQPVEGFLSLLFGALLVVAGLAFFIFGLRLALFPIGEALAHALARKGSAFWLFAFAFTLGFGTTIAEPALLAVAEEAAEVAVGAGVIASDEAAIENYALGLRLVVALSVGVALLLGVFRILTNWSLPGVGLASSLKGRNPMTDGFGLIAFASLTPILFVMLYGIALQWL
jgi:hypothetical protein